MPAAVLGRRIDGGAHLVGEDHFRLAEDGAKVQLRPSFVRDGGECLDDGHAIAHRHCRVADFDEFALALHQQRFAFRDDDRALDSSSLRRACWSPRLMGVPGDGFEFLHIISPFLLGLSAWAVPGAGAGRW